MMDNGFCYKNDLLMQFLHDLSPWKKVEKKKKFLFSTFSFWYKSTAIGNKSIMAQNDSS